MTQSRPSRLSQPPSVPNDAAAGSGLAQLSGEQANDGCIIRGDHRRRLAQHHQLERHPRHRLHHRSHPVGHLISRHSGQEPNAEIEHAVGRDHVGGSTTGDSSDVEGNVGDLGEVLRVRRPLPLERLAEVGECCDRSAGRLHRVHAEMRKPTVGGDAGEGEPEPHVALVHAQDPERGRLADDGGPR